MSTQCAADEGVASFGAAASSCAVRGEIAREATIAVAIASEAI
jgi:hypothetical protein